MKDLKIDAWKFYTGDPAGPWRHDDEKVAYPFYERSRALGAEGQFLPHLERGPVVGRSDDKDSRGAHAGESTPVAARAVSAAIRETLA